MYASSMLSSSSFSILNAYILDANRPTTMNLRKFRRATVKKQLLDDMIKTASKTESNTIKIKEENLVEPVDDGINDVIEIVNMIYR